MAASLTSGGTAPATSLDRRAKVALVVLLTASFTLAVDFSILNVALPSIGADVGLSLGNLQWIATSFALCAAGFTLFFGRVADLFGKRRLFLVGMALLGIASFVGGLAVNPAMLITARIAQGLATAAVTPAALALLTTTFPEGPLRERALGLNGALMAGGFTTGAILGGILTDVLSWNWAFFINVPIALAVVAVAPLVLREHRPATRPRLDVPGAITVTLGLLAIVFGLSRAGERSWDDPLSLTALVAGMGLLVLFYFVERLVAQPLISVAVLGRRTVAWGNVAGILAFVTETSLVFLLTLYLQEVLGYTPLGAGLALAMLGLGTVLGAILGPRAIAKLGSRRTIVTGFTVQGLSTVPLIFLGSERGWIAVVLVATFIGGIANLCAIIGYMVTATSGLPDHEQGLATGLAIMSQQIGITMGTPIVSAIVAATLPGTTAPHSAELLHALSTAITVNAALCLATAAALAFALPKRSAATTPGA
ncbi:EmrB/QacA subfamily drug resistance transporter [Kribbella sp. VKM Ac-2527]|uniref:EmrB/QacA subfamily drug resistance transporter n=1 Tax=Kribbella caucasensis TaxID=2512215 RepID=A0A4R6KBH1_9ACTN|nr:MFS transporter [Kribbella sp. VKM Ac-2527]TDO47352.1 EmrB/QacA subfamily drug resistance transporter [Kribbella sp. VKM Ac-2527]